MLCLCAQAGRNGQKVQRTEQVETRKRKCEKGTESDDALDTESTPTMKQTRLSQPQTLSHTHVHMQAVTGARDKF